MNDIIWTEQKSLFHFDDLNTSFSAVTRVCAHARSALLETGGTTGLDFVHLSGCTSIQDKVVQTLEGLFSSALWGPKSARRQPAPAAAWPDVNNTANLGVYGASQADKMEKRHASSTWPQFNCQMPCVATGKLNYQCLPKHMPMVEFWDQRFDGCRLWGR